MRWAAFVLCVAFVSCVNFDQLGQETKCRSGLCPDVGGGVGGGGTVTGGGGGGGGSTDAGDAGGDAGTDAGVDAGDDAGSDAGSDAGVDAGTDAGSDAGVDAGPVPVSIELVPLWQRTLSTGVRMGTASGKVIDSTRANLVVWIASSASPYSDPNMQAGYVGSAMRYFSTRTGDFLMPDGGFEPNENGNMIDYIPEMPISVSARGGYVYVAASERVIDGGRAPPNDGGSATLADGGYFLHGFGDTVWRLPRDGTIDRVPFYVSGGNPTAAGGVSFNSTVIPAWVRNVGTNQSTFEGYSSGVQLFNTSFCQADTLDNAVVTQGTDRLVTLVNCNGGPAVVSYAVGGQPTMIVALPAVGTSARMGVAPEGTAGRAPRVAWMSQTSRLRIGLTNSDGNVLVTSTVVTQSSAPETKVSAVTVNVRNEMTVFLEGTSAIQFDGLPQLSNPVEQAYVAHFDDQLRLLWAAVVHTPTKPGPVSFDSATWASGELIADVPCPPFDAGVCEATGSSVLMRLAQKDGGFP